MTSAALREASTADLLREGARRDLARKRGECPWCGRWQGTDPQTCGQPEQHREAQQGWAGRWLVVGSTGLATAYYKPEIDTCRAWGISIDWIRRNAVLALDGCLVATIGFADWLNSRQIDQAIAWAESQPVFVDWHAKVGSAAHG